MGKFGNKIYNHSISFLFLHLPQPCLRFDPLSTSFALHDFIKEKKPKFRTLFALALITNPSSKLSRLSLRKKQKNYTG